MKMAIVIEVAWASSFDPLIRLVEFLVSDNQTSITGQSLDINNGALMP